MALIKLTQIPHPELNGGKSVPCYIDPSRILVIDSGTNTFTKLKSLMAYREAIHALHQEVHGIMAQLNSHVPSMIPENDREAKLVDIFVQAKGAADALSNAANLVEKYANTPDYHPEQPCTVVHLACGTGLEHGVMLSRVFVVETPEEVANAVTRARIAKYPEPYHAL